ncbi:MAG: Hpt domain-containing protein [Planctomycetaceae bacterium]
MIDQQQLLVNTGNDPVLAYQLCEAFVSSSTELEAELRAACLSHDHELLSRTAHTLKSAFDVLGAVEQRDLALQVELLASARGSTGAEADLLTLSHRLLGEVVSVRAAVRQLLD